MLFSKTTCLINIYLKPSCCLPPMPNTTHTHLKVLSTRNPSWQSRTLGWSGCCATSSCVCTLYKYIHYIVIYPVKTCIDMYRSIVNFSSVKLCKKLFVNQELLFEGTENDDIKRTVYNLFWFGVRGQLKIEQVTAAIGEIVVSLILESHKNYIFSQSQPL